MADHLARPPTPQAMVHRLPDSVGSIEADTKPSKFIILIAASTAVAGKVQIAKSVAAALHCPLYQGDSLHETAAKASSVGVPKASSGAQADAQIPLSGANEARYQRMWLSKMTRTGLLFPEESRAAGAGFSGFGGPSSSSTSRRGSSSSDASDWSNSDAVGSTSSLASSTMTPAPPKYINKPTQLEDQSPGRANSALMVVTHPQLEKWHKECIRKAVGQYSIGVIFVPLEGDEALPVLKPLDPTTMTSFGSFNNFRAARRWNEEIVLRVNVDAKVEDLVEDVVDGAKDIMNE